MLRLIALLVVTAVAVPGCGGGANPQDEEKRKNEMAALRLDMNSKFADLEKRYAGVLQMEQQAKNALEDAKKMTRVTGDVVAVLKAQEAALKDYLRAIQEAIKALEPR